MVAIATLTVAVCLPACSSGGTDVVAGGGGASGLQYGTDEYAAARIQLYVDAGRIEPERLTAENLPWDPNGPTIKISELTASLNQAALYDNSDEYAGARREMEKLTEQVRFACSGELVGRAAAAQVDQAITILRYGEGLGGGGVDASGGVDCEDGTTVGGTGQPLVRYEDDQITLGGGSPLEVQEVLVP
nr:hypothetical protein [Rhodococcus qingshengii]